jgi:hypothetical protein
MAGAAPRVYTRRMSFVDPRAGDLEDDASSTVRHSLLGHATHMLLEISLPKLLLAAALLLLLPALLIGATPKLLLWFAESVWYQVSDFGRVLSVSLFLAVLGFVAWRWGRRLFVSIERNFWALNAGLVQPLYTALRELVRMVIERIAQRRDFAATRRVAGLVAGAVIALAAGSVAWWLGPLPTISMGNTSALGLAASARDSLVNGGWAIAVYLMIGAPAWSIAEAMAGTPEDLAPRADAASARWRVVHLSDLHVVGESFGFRLECGRDGPRGNHRLDRLFALLEAEDARARIDWILVSGDITDAGRNAEFIAFDDLLAAHPTLRDRVLILPGNHDVNIVDRANPARLELPIAPGGALRRLRFLAAAARLQGARVFTVDRAARRLGPTLDGFLAEGGRGARLARFMDAGGVRAGAQARRDWDLAYPQVVPPATADGLGVILLDSNAETHFSFTNALGLVGMAQLRAAEAAMRAFPDAHWIVALHHHLVEYPRPGAPLAERIGTALVNGHWVLQRLRRIAPRLIVMHGHRHYDWMGRCGGLRILSAPSPVMGAMDDAPRHVWLHSFATDPKGGLRLLTPQRLSVPGG